MRRYGGAKGHKKKKWTQGDLDFLKASYLFFTDEELAQILGRSVKTIHSVRAYYGLFKKQAKPKTEDILRKIQIVFLHKRDEFESDRDEVIDTIC